MCASVLSARQGMLLPVAVLGAYLLKALNVRSANFSATSARHPQHYPHSLPSLHAEAAAVGSLVVDQRNNMGPDATLPCTVQITVRRGPFLDLQHLGCRSCAVVVLQQLASLPAWVTATVDPYDWPWILRWPAQCCVGPAQPRLLFTQAAAHVLLGCC